MRRPVLEYLLCSPQALAVYRDEFDRGPTSVLLVGRNLMDINLGRYFCLRSFYA